MKQIILMRTDLGMRKGKMIAQGAHASMKAVVLHYEDPRIVEWLSGSFTKVVVKVDSEEQINNICLAAIEAGLIAESIVDEGRTTFHGVPTLTCAAIGPDTDENLRNITGDLKLL